MIDTIIQSFDIWTTAQGLKAKGRVKSIENISLEGIARLREIILELAVSGKLVKQDPNDEPANELLRKIEKEKDRLVKEKKIRKQEVYPKIDDNEEPYGIPSNWVWTWLPNMYYTISPSNKKLKNSNIIEAGEYPVVDQGKTFIAGYTNAKELLIEIPGPVIVFGDHTTVKKYVDFNFVAGADGTRILRPYKMNERYFYMYLLSYKLEDRGYSRHFKFLNDNYFALPPLAEQHRIVAKVDELMALCDKLEKEQFTNLKTHQVLVKTLIETLTQATDANELQAAWQRMSAHFDTLFCTDDSIDQLKQTILQLAVMGKLVKQNPTDEPASDLLKRIAKEKEKLVNEKKLKKQKPLPKIAEEAKPFEIPSSWLWVPWGSILAYDDYPFKRGPFGSSLKKDMFIESGYKVYEQYCPINDDCSYERYYISDELYKNLEGFAVRANDYLISCSGATLGRITQVPSKFKEGIINQALLRVRINHEYVDKDFFKLLFRSPYFQKMISDNSTGSAIPNVKGVNDLKVMPVPLLSLSEQQKILNKINELYNICDSLKEKIQKSQNIKVLLSKTIVEKAIH